MGCTVWECAKWVTSSGVYSVGVRGVGMVSENDIRVNTKCEDGIRASG